MGCRKKYLCADCMGSNLWPEKLCKGATVMAERSNGPTWDELEDCSIFSGGF